MSTASAAQPRDPATQASVAIDGGCRTNSRFDQYLVMNDSR